MKPEKVEFLLHSIKEALGKEIQVTNSKKDKFISVDIQTGTSDFRNLENYGKKYGIWEIQENGGYGTAVIPTERFWYRYNLKPELVTLVKTVENYNTRYKYLEDLKESGKLYVRKDISNISVGDYAYGYGLVKSVDKVKRKITCVSLFTTEDYLGNKFTKLVYKTYPFYEITNFASDKPASEETVEEYDTEKRIFPEITEHPFSNLEMDVLLSDVHRIKIIHERGELNLNVESGMPYFSSFEGGTFYDLYKVFHKDFYNSPHTKLAREFISKLKKYFSTFDKTEKYWIETNNDVLTIYLFNPNQVVPSIQHWKMTWEEYAQTVYISSGQKEAIQNAWAKVVKPTNKAAYNQLLEEWWEANNPHRKLVLKAYSEGKPVPTHILKFYKLMKNNILAGLQGFGFVPGLPSVGDKVYSTNSTTIYTVGAAAWQTGAPIGTTPLTKITEAGKYIGKVRSIKGDIITLDYDKPRFVKYSEVQKEGTPGSAPNPNVPAPFGPGTTEPPKPETDTNSNATGSSIKKYLPLALAAAAGLALYSMSSGGTGRRKKKKSGLFGPGTKTIPVKIGNQTMKIHLKTTEVK